jgi:hypothetical protein
MNRSFMLPMSAVALFGLAVSAPFSDAAAGQDTLKERLVGTWTLVSWEEMLPDGTKVAALGDANSKGVLMFDAAGHVSFQIIAELPKLASNDRKKTTPEENKALAQGVFSYFGTYSVSETHHSMTIHVEGSTFPNMNGTDSKRTITSLTANELTYTNPATLAGRRSLFVWKRAQPTLLTVMIAPAR